MSISHRLLSSAIIATASILPSQAIAYRYIEPKVFVVEQAPRILRHLGANDALVRINGVAANKMSEIIASQMVQGMAQGTLSKGEWDRKYMKADALYIYNLGCALAIRAQKEEDNLQMKELAEMFLGYGKHFERLKKYGLSENDRLVSAECDQHIAFLSKSSSISEFYFAILTDMIPYVVFANYLLHSIEDDHNPWKEYAEKYGNLNNKYAKEKLGKTIQIANRILRDRKIDESSAEGLFQKGFTFEEWFIRNAFSKEGFIVESVENQL